MKGEFSAVFPLDPVPGVGARGEIREVEVRVRKAGDA